MKKTLCILLVLTMTLSALVSCGDDESMSLSETNESSFVTDTQEVESFSNDVFVYIKEAWNNSTSYNGAYTQNSSFEVRYTDGTEYGEYMTTFDPQTNNYYIKESDQGKLYREQKNFTQNNNYYSCDKNGKGELSYSYMKKTASDNYATLNFGFDFHDTGYEIFDALPNISLAESITELKSAYEEVTKDAVDCPYEDIESYTVDITTEHINETYSLKIYLYYIRDNRTARKTEMLVQAKDNMICNLEYSSGGTTMQAKYAYDFDEQLYNQLNVTLPEDLSSIQHIDYGKKIYFHFKNAYAPVSAFSNDQYTISDSYSDIIASCSIDLSKYTWYTDPQLTKIFDLEAISEEDWYAVENLYTGEKDADTSTVCHITYRHNINKAYGIVWGVDPVSSSGTSVVAHGAAKQFFPERSSLLNQYLGETHHNNNAENAEVYINGIKQSQGSTYFTVNGADIYEIEIVYKDTYIGH